MLDAQHIQQAFKRFNPELIITSLTALVSGLSNDNYLVRCTTKAYLIKHYRDHWPDVGLDAQKHFANEGLCPAPLWLDKQNHLAIFTYIEGETANFYHHKLMAQLKAIHNYPLQTSAMNLKEELAYYQACPLYQKYLKPVEKALKIISQSPVNAGFCHNDLVRENIINNKNELYLIDFEYAKTNDVYFDLASLVVSFNMDTKQKQQMLNQYQQQSQAQSVFYNSLDKLTSYQVIFLVLCICWYQQRHISNKVTELCAQLESVIVELK